MPELLDPLPIGQIRLDTVAEPTLRRFFDAFRLEVHNDDRVGIVECQVTLTGGAGPRHSANERTRSSITAAGTMILPTSVVPPVGFEPTATALLGGLPLPLGYEGRGQENGRGE